MFREAALRDESFSIFQLDVGPGYTKTDFRLEVTDGKQQQIILKYKMKTGPEFQRGLGLESEDKIELENLKIMLVGERVSIHLLQK